MTRSVLLWLAALSVVFLSACSDLSGTTGSASAQAPDSAVETGPAIWRLSDADTDIYLFGTIHELRPDIAWRSDRFDRVLDTADLIYVEADVDGAQAGERFAELMLELGVYDADHRLSEVLNPTERVALRQGLDELGLSPAAVDTLKPWMAAMQISAVQTGRRGYHPASGVERVIEAAAAERGVSLAYLETAEHQLRVFAALPEADQIAFLLATARDVTDGPGRLDALVDAWIAGDVASIGAIMSEPGALGSRHVYDQVLVARNRDWVPKIEAMLDQPGTLLVAVGAGHLAGEDSVVVMLRERGHTVFGP